MKLKALPGSVRVAALSALQRDWRENSQWLRRGFSLDRAALERRQLERLSTLIARFNGLGLQDRFPEQPALISRAELGSLPLLSREGLRALRPRMDELHRGRRDTIEERTSGTTGIPVTLLVDRRWLRMNECQKFELQSLAGARPSMPQVCLWSNPTDIGLPAAQRGRLSALFFPRAMFNAYIPDDSVYEQIYRAVLASPGCMVVGYAGALAECATRMVARGWIVPPGVVAAGWTGSEAQTPQRREILRRAFGATLREMYGTHELHWVSMECLEGTRHISPRHIVEVVDPESGEALPEGQLGEIVITDLFNETTPLIRYVVGDRGSIEWRDCACGRRGYAITELFGRSAEVIRLPSGRNVHSLVVSRVMRLSRAVLQWQLIRRGRFEFVIEYVGETLEPDVEARMLEIIGAALEGAKLGLRPVERIERSASGKFSYYREDWQDPGAEA